MRRAALVWAFGACGAVAFAQDGVSADTLLLGMANAHSGPASGLGIALRTGSQAYLDRVNAAGGVEGRKLKLIVRDDGYEPSQSVAVTQRLLEQDKVFTLFGYVGTPTSVAVVPLASNAKVPYLFPFTGAEFLRNPVNKYVFNVRASYFDETETMVKHLTTDVQAQKIAMLIQDDPFGAAVKSGVERALLKRNMKLHAESRIKRNSLEVDAAVASLAQVQPDAIVFAGTYKQLAAAVKKARELGVKSRFLTVSFIGTENFIADAGAVGDGVYITQVMPSPSDSTVPVVKSYLADMKGQPAGYTSLEGYVNAMVLVEALKKAGAQPTRESLVTALETLKLDLGGFSVDFSPTSHQGSKSVFLTQVLSGKAVPQQKIH